MTFFTLCVDFPPTVETSTKRAALRSRRVSQLEAKHGEPIEQLLRRLYYTENLTQAQVAKRLRVPAGTVANWLIRLGINQRALAEQAAKDLSA